MKQYKPFVIYLLQFKVNHRHWVKFCLYLLAYSLCVTFCFSESYHLSLITDTEYQGSAFTISKGRNTF